MNGAYHHIAIVQRDKRIKELEDALKRIMLKAEHDMRPPDFINEKKALDPKEIKNFCARILKGDRL